MNIIENLRKEIFPKINESRKKKNMSWSEIVWELKKRGVKCNSNTPYDWKVGKSNGFLDCLSEISEILDIPKEELSAIANECFANNINYSFNNSPHSTLNIGTTPKQFMSKQETELIEMYRNFSLENQIKFVNFGLSLKSQK